MFQGSVPVWLVYALVAYFLAFTVITGGLYLWQTFRRKERPPERFKLLRGPGESQRRRVQKADEDLFLHVFAGAFAPLVVAWLVLLLAVRLPKNLILVGIITSLLAFAGSLIACYSFLVRFLRRRRNDQLGYLGERSVAEYLEPLLAEGYRVFHDVPAKGRD